MLYVPTTDAANAMVGVTGCDHRCSIRWREIRRGRKTHPSAAHLVERWHFGPIGFTIALPK